MMKSYYDIKSVFTIFGKYVYGFILIIIFREYIKGFPLVKSESLSLIIGLNRRNQSKLPFTLLKSLKTFEKTFKVMGLDTQQFRSF